MEFFGIAITILAAILTYQAWKNGRWMKQGMEWMKQAHQDTQDLIRQTHRDTQDLIREMHKDMVESFRKMDETSREVRTTTDQTLREIARLIVAEGEKTRQAV
jgi:uncharacterized membrane-anchored protein YhcB (DUF1043 family)